MELWEASSETHTVCLDRDKWREKKERDLKGCRIIVWITKRKGRDLEGRSLEGKRGQILLRIQFFLKWKDFNYVWIATLERKERKGRGREMEGKKLLFV